MSDKRPPAKSVRKDSAPKSPSSSKPNEPQKSPKVEVKRKTSISKRLSSAFSSNTSGSSISKSPSNQSFNNAKKLIKFTQIPPKTSLRVIQNYKAKADGELTLDVDDIVELDVTPISDKEVMLQGTNRSWGENNGLSGLFPTYCVEIDIGSPSHSYASLHPSSSNRRSRSHDIDDIIIKEPIAVGSQVIAILNYFPQKSDELELEIGDIIVVTDSPNGGW